MEKDFIIRILQPEFSMKITQIRMESANNEGLPYTQMFTRHQSLFHYTSLSGLMGIIDTKTLWLTNVLYLNDTSEQIYAMRLIRNIVSSLSLSGNYSKSFANLLTPNSSTFKDIESLYNNPAYISCFTTDGDSLYMWLGYCDQCGVAIEFDLKSDYTFAFGPNCFFRDLVYDENILADKTTRIINEFYKVYNSEKVDESLEKVYIREIYDSLFHMSSDFKNPSFNLEKETRLHYRPKSNNEIKFRLRGNLIISYIALPLEDINHGKKLPIKSITLGPCKDQYLVRSSISDFVRNRGYDIEIRLSSIPFSDRH